MGKRNESGVKNSPAPPASVILSLSMGDNPKMFHTETARNFAMTLRVIHMILLSSGLHFR